MQKKHHVLLVTVFLPQFVVFAAVPPNPYVDEGVCPFECCRLGTWTTRQAIELVDKPYGKQVITKIGKGEEVEALTGNVYVKPLAVDVFEAKGEFKKGDVFYLLSNVGEGIIKAWFEGETTEIDFYGIDGLWGQTCSEERAECWAKVRGGGEVGEYFKGDWWVKVNDRGGKVGWILYDNQFSGADACE